MSDEKRPSTGRAKFISTGKARDRVPLRRPGERAPPNNDSNPNLTNCARSSLSPMAAEFVPRSASIPQSSIVERTNFNSDLVLDSAVYQNGDCENISVAHVRTIMYEITINPGKFDSLATLLVDALNVTIQDEVTLRAIVDEIFEQAVTESNFRYNGARLCNYLSKSLTVVFNSYGFRGYLFQRCQQEFALKDKLIKDADGCERLRGFTMLMGELFIHLEILVDGRLQKIRLLGVTLPQLLETLLTFPSKENLKCVCQILKFTGAALEDHERANNDGASPSIDNVIQAMRQLALNESFDRTLKDMLNGVVELRATDWGRVSTSPVVRDEVPELPLAAGVEPVLYGPDGIPISSEEALFLESNHYLYDTASTEDECNDIDYYGQTSSLWSTSDDMDDDMVAEFEKFLLENS